MQKIIAASFFTALFCFSAQASDSKQEAKADRAAKKIAHKQLRPYAMESSLWMAIVYSLEHAHTKNDSLITKTVHTLVENKARKKLLDAAKAEQEKRKQLRKNWPALKEIASKQPKTRAKL